MDTLTIIWNHITLAIGQGIDWFTPVVTANHGVLMAPEMDPGSAMSAVTLLCFALAILRNK